jgi:hypothetical protein
LVPAVGVAIWVWARSGAGHGLRERGTAIALWIGGLALTVLCFLPFLGETYDALESKSGSPQYGGMSILSVFNPASPKGSGTYYAFASNIANAQLVLDGLRVLAVVAVFAAILWVAMRAGPLNRTGADERLGLLAMVTTWTFAAVLLADSSPQSENLVGLLPFLLLSLPFLGRQWGLVTFTTLTLCGFVEYLSLLTPFGVFYPLAVVIGPGAVGWINGITIGYVAFTGLRGIIWLVLGLVAGLTLLAIWLRAGWAALPRRGREVLRGGSGSPPADA